jgi:hypothetical protein
MFLSFFLYGSNILSSIEIGRVEIMRKRGWGGAEAHPTANICPFLGEAGLLYQSACG